MARRIAGYDLALLYNKKTGKFWSKEKKANQY